jgi:hypothetical protein
MKLEFSLTKDDMLQMQLFMASISEQVKRNRKKSRLIVPVAYVVLGIIVIVSSDIVFGSVFIALGIVMYFLYPGILAKRYEKMYRKNVDENLANRADKPVELTFGDEYIESKDYTGEAKLKISTIERVDEVRDYCFLKFDSGVGLVIPLNQISERNGFIAYIKTLAADNAIAYHTDLDWRWK